MNQGFFFVKLRSSLRKPYGRHHELGDRYGVSVSHMIIYMFHLSQVLPAPFLIHNLSPGFIQIKTTGANSGAGISYPSGTYEFTTRFYLGSCYSIFGFICMFCRSLFVPFYFFFWPLCCLFFFDIRIMITPLVSSNSYCHF